MNTWQEALLLAACLALVGCRAHPATTALERENRTLEDQVYALQDDLERAVHQLEKCRCDGRTPPASEPAAGPPRRAAPLDAGATASPADSPQPPAVIRGPELRPLNGSKPAPGKADPLELPRVDLPGVKPGALRRPSSRHAHPARVPAALARRSPTVAPRPAASAASAASPAKPTTGQRAPAQPSPVYLVGYEEQVAAGTPVDPRSDSAAVDRIDVDGGLSGGFDADRRPGDDGITLVVGPRDKQGKPIAAAGAISVALLDPALAGEAARVARWDLSAEETARLYRRMPRTEGFCLKLPWPSEGPRHNRLHVFVRFTAADGRKVQADSPINVVLPNDSAANWIAVPSRPETEPANPSDHAPSASGERLAAAEEPVREPTAGAAPSPRRRPTWSPYR